MGVLTYILLALAMPAPTVAAYQEPTLTPSIKSTGLEKAENPPVALVGSTLKVVSSKSVFSVAGPPGSTFQFQPTVPKGSSYQTASLQVNGVDVSLGRFEDGVAPSLGYSPSNPEEIVLYRAAAGGAAQTIATYKVRTDGHDLHPLPLAMRDYQLGSASGKQGSYLVFGPSGALGIAAHGPFSFDLSGFPSGTLDFETVYVDGDYAETPTKTEATVEPRFQIEGLDQPVPHGNPATFHVTDLRHKGISSLVVYLSGRRLGEFDDWQSGITINLSSYRPGSYRLAVYARLGDGTTVGPETRMLEIGEEASAQKPVEVPTTLRDIVIESAWFGAPGGPGRDVTAKVAAMFAAGTTINATTSAFGDPAVGYHKQLVVNYSVRGKAGTLTAPEDGVLDFSAAIGGSKPTPTGGLRVLSAVYEGLDVTDKIRALVASGQTSIQVDTEWLRVPDPAPGYHKTLSITVTYPDGSEKVFRGGEGDTISSRSLD
jgi:hypothetical protein